MIEVVSTTSKRGCVKERMSLGNFGEPNGENKDWFMFKAYVIAGVSILFGFAGLIITIIKLN